MTDGVFRIGEWCIDEEYVPCPVCGADITDWVLVNCDYNGKDYEYRCEECGHEGRFASHEVVKYVE